MNISSLNSVTSNPQPVGRPVPTQKDASKDGIASKPHGAHHYNRSPQVADAVEATEATAVPDQDGDQDDGRRVSNLASRVNARLQNAITSGNLSTEQTVALKDAAAQFQALMTRIGNAGQTDTTRRAVHFALHQLRQQIQGIFNAQGSSPEGSGGTVTSGTEIADAITAPAVDTVA